MGVGGGANMKQIDFVMPIHNRWEHTLQSLRSLVLHTNPKDINIYLINDGSDQNTSADLYGWISANEYPFVIKYFHNKEAIGPGPSRNLVTASIKQEERSKYLYHSDNDVYFKDGWLKALVYMYEKVNATFGKVKLLGGGCHPYLQNNTSYSFQSEEYKIGIKDAVSGYSQLMLWETWDQYGPFDESMRNAERKIMGSEDWAFCQKIIKDGFLVGSLEPEVVIHTGKRNTYGDLATGHEIAFPDEEGIQKI